MKRSDLGGAAAHTAAGQGITGEADPVIRSEDLTPEELEDLERRAERYGIPCVTELHERFLDPDLVAGVPVEWTRANGVLPVMIDGEVCVLTAAPESVNVQEDLSLLMGRELHPVLAPAGVIARAIERCYYRKEESPTTFLDDLQAEGAPTVTSRADDLLERGRQAPVSQLVNLILLEAVKRDASDVHVEPFESELRVRYRIDGILYEQSQPPKHMEEAIVSRLKVMARMDIAERRLPQDGMARVRVGEREIDIRVSTVPVAEGERVVLRLLDRDSTLLPLESLGLPAGVLEGLQRLLRERSGLIAVCGPTGAGKTTTLYAALGHLDASRKNILTIEDPIEYQLPGIGQMQVKPKIGLTFAGGLRHILRQDPDCILVGEMRDLETAEIAIRASLTGHLVFTTLHTNDAAGAVVRLIDMGVEPYLLASCLKGVLAQRLVRRLCKTCKRPRRYDAKEVRAALGSVGGREESDLEAWEAVGCTACLEGYRGRTGLFELLPITTDLQQRIRSGQPGAAELQHAAAEAGVRSLLADGLDKVRAGTTSLAEVLNVAPE